MIAEAEFTIASELGLHARPAGEFAALASKFAAEVSVARAGMQFFTFGFGTQACATSWQTASMLNVVSTVDAGLVASPSDGPCSRLRPRPLT